MSAPAAAEASETQPPSVEPVQAVQESELDRELSKAREDPDNFNQWVAVEKLVAKEPEIEKIREVYNGLLTAFPLCYGYWKKFADAEHSRGFPEAALSVFERGASAVPYSVDLWGHYCLFQQKIEASPDTIRKTFEQGAAYVGTDHLAHSFWDKYIKFQTEQGSTEHLVQLYLRVLRAPLKDLDRFLASFETLAASHQLSELIAPDEIVELKAQLLDTKAAKAKLTAEVAPTAEQLVQPSLNGHATDSQGEDKETLQPTALKPEDDKAGSLNKIENQDAQLEGEEEKFQSVVQEDLVVSDDEAKEGWISSVKSIYEETKKEVAQRLPFESQIKRPYFHVKPLPLLQLQAWWSYIDFILTKDDPGAIIRLFERCLVACASHPEFWIRYVRYLEGQEPANAKSALQRAQQIFCKKEVALHLFAAKFEERHGEVEAARATYKKVLTELAPNLVEAIVQAASFERRQGHLAAATTYFDTALEQEEKAEDDLQRPTLAIFYAKFLWQGCSDTSAAREVYRKALARWPSLLYLRKAAIHFEEHCLEEGRTGMPFPHRPRDRVLSLYSEAVAEPSEGSSAHLSAEDQELLSEQLIDFADTFASPEKRELFAAEHELRYGKYKKESVAGKRSADASLENPASKKSALGPASSGYLDPSAAGATNGSQQAPSPYQTQHYAPQLPASAGYGDPNAHAQAPYYSAGPQALNYAQYYPYAQQQQYGYQYPGYS